MTPQKKSKLSRYMSKDKFSQLQTKVQDKSIPEGKAKCLDCGSLINATFIEINSHFRPQANMLPENKETVSVFVQNQ